MKKTTDNKGFSLIELIIVIAIMAVLVAIIAPNLTKYLGSSKKNTDLKNADEIAATLKTCITDYEMDPANGSLLAKNDSTGMTLVWDGSTCAGTGSSNTNASFTGLVDAAIDPTKPKSKEANSYGRAVITTDANGTYKILVTIGNESVNN